MSLPTGHAAADLERRFGGLARLYGPLAYQRLRALRIAVVGLGGVGSWAVEALSRSGVAELTLIDFDHVSESNINRQIQALESTLGQSKAAALAQRIGDIHPQCQVRLVDDFVTPENWPALLPGPVDVVIDACDQVSAKTALAAWSLGEGVQLVTAGAAGGKQSPERVETQDLAHVTHDPLLAALRQRLRKHHAAPRVGDMGVMCVFSREPVRAPSQVSSAQGLACDPLPLPAPEPGLHCAGYGSSVMVTATFGMTAAALAIRLALSFVPAARA